MKSSYKKEIGFLISDSSDLTFLYPFIVELGAANIKILYDDRDETKSLYGNSKMDVTRKLPQDFVSKNYVSISELLETDFKFDLLISIHPYIVHDFIKFAKSNFRLSYSISKNSWQFGEINSYYDLIFTQGPYSSYVIQAKYGIQCLQVGYPRYLIDSKSDSSIGSKINLNSGLPLISLFPPIGSLIVKIAEQELLKMLDSYNIVIKVHPIETSEMKSYYRTLSEKFFVKFEDDGINLSNESLIKLSDLVIHERGGTCFSSLYFKRNFAFFERDIPHVGNNREIFKLDAEDLLYRLVERSVSVSNLVNDVKSFLESPIKYDERFDKISSIFITNKSGKNFKKALRVILNSKNPLNSSYQNSKFFKKLRKSFSKIRFFPMFLRLIKLLKNL